MKILSIAFKDFSKKHFGASKKVISECKVLAEMGNGVTLIGREYTNTVIVNVDKDGENTVVGYHRKLPVGKLQNLYDKNKQIKDIEKFIAGKKFDLCYIRYDLSTVFFIHLLKALKKCCRKIVIEIPTYPYGNEYKGRINAVRLKIDDYYGNKLKKYVDLIVSFYPVDSDTLFGVKYLQVPNGFDFSDIELIHDDEVPEKIEIAAVSSMREWHGYERFIKGLKEYYSNGGERDIILHLVGDGRECPKYSRLVLEYGLNDHIVFHGAMFGEALDSLLEQCTLGIDSLARHRSGITVLSSLKSREYGAKGIPFINSGKIDIVDKDFKYMLEVPVNESPVDINGVIDFYDEVFKLGSRLQVAREIRSYIEERSNMKEVMSSVLCNLNNDK